MTTSESVDTFEPASESQAARSASNDRGLEVVGFIFAGVTVIVIAIAVLVLHRHVAGKDGAAQSVRAAPTVSVRR